MVALCNTKMTKYSAECHYPESHIASCSGAMIFSILALTKQNDIWTISDLDVYSKTMTKP
jgi:hypothetical protein